MKNKILTLVFAAVAVGLLGGLIIYLTSSSEGGGTKGGDGEVVKLGSHSAAIPKEWIKEKPKTLLRKHQFRVPKVKEDEKEKDAEVLVFEGFGGSIEENVARWKAKFKAPKGKTTEEISKVDAFKVSGVAVTYVDISGIYQHQEPPSPAVTPFPKYRMVAFIFDSEDDVPYFVTLIGPEATVAQAKKGFDGWLKALK